MARFFLMLAWLSFCDVHKPAGSQFLGVVIVEIPDQGSDRENSGLAITIAWFYQLNPGGEVGYAAVPAEEEHRFRPYMHRLLSREDLERAGLAPTSIQ